MNISQKKTTLETPTSIVYERKFDTALRSTFLQTTEDRLRELKDLHVCDRYLPEYISSIYPKYEVRTTPEHYALFLKDLLGRSRLLSQPPKQKRMFQRVKTLVNGNLELQLRYCQKQNFTHIHMSTLQKYKMWEYSTDLPPLVINLLTISVELGKMIDNSQLMFNYKYKKMDLDEYIKKMMKKNQYTIQEIPITWYWSESLLYIFVNDSLYVQPRAVMLMYHNKVCDLISVLLYSVYSGPSSLPEDAYSITVRFVTLLCNLIIRYQNSGFTIIKTLEGLVIAETLIEIEEWSNLEFLQVITQDLRTSVGFDYDSSEIKAILVAADIPFRHDLGCLSKIVGHPLVDIKGGSEKLYHKVNDPIEINYQKVVECINHFKKDYIKKHVQKYRKWPPTKVLPLSAPKGLRMCQIYGRDPDSMWAKTRFGPTPVLHYGFVELEKSLEFNRLENIIPYLKDKTISLMRSEVLGKYMEKIKPDEEWSKVRLLLVYLLHPSMVCDHTKYLDKYCNSSDFSKLMDYLVIKVVPKEKELKIHFRGFGCKTYEDRYRALVQEKNVAIYLGEFSDEQTLTSGDLQIIKKLDAFRRIRNAYKGHHALYIVIDASSWNNRFSSHTVDDFGAATLDRIFDSTIFSKTHKAYEKSLVYVADGVGAHYWEGQRGGIEGLNQYTWMAAYISQMKVAMENFPFKYHILCKGDDMRIVVMVPEADYSTDDLRDLKNHIVQHISETCKEFGHSINTEESYGSSHYFAFSKSASVDNVELPQTYRKIQKVYGANNAFINTLDDYVASTLSNGHGACKVSPSVFPCYAVSLTWFFTYLIDHPAYRSLSNDQFIALSLVPNLLGGFPIIYLHNFHSRAESDLLSPFLDIIEFCRDQYQSIYPLLCNFLYVTCEVPLTFESLYADPYSLPLSRPPIPSNILRSYIPNQLKRITKNRDVLSLIKLAQSPAQQEIVTCLDSANVLRIKALASIYSSSPKALLTEQTRKFETGKSVLDLLLIRRNKRSVNRILLRVLKADVRLQEWRRKRLLGKNHSNDRSLHHCITNCPAESAYAIRKYSYGMAVEDITMPPLQHQMRVAYPAEGTRDVWAMNNHFTYHVKLPEESFTSDSRMHYSCSSFNPFLGYTTRTGQINPSMHFVEKDETLSKVKTLLEVCNWMNVSVITTAGEEKTSNIVKLVEKLLTLYTDTPLDVLAPFAGVRKSGTAQHHMRSPNFRESIVPNTLSNMYTWIKGESSTHIVLQSSSAHYRINFLHCYCYMVWMIVSELDVSKSCSAPSLLWGITTSCHYCNTPIEEEPLILDEGLIANISLPELKVVKLTQISERILMESILKSGVRTANIKSDIDRVSHRMATFGICQYLADMLCYDRKGIEDRFTQHAVSKEGFHILSILSGSGHDRDVGLTEIKSLNIPATVDAIIQLVINLLHLEVPIGELSKLQTWLSITPTWSLPWSGLIQWFESAGKLPELLAEFHRVSLIAPTGCYYNAASASRYIGYVSLEYIDNRRPGTELIFLSHYTETNLVPYLQVMLRQLLFNNLAALTSVTSIMNVLYDPNIIDKDPATILLFEHLYLRSRFDRLSREVDDIAADITNNRRIQYEIDILDIVEEEEVITEILNMMEDQHTKKDIKECTKYLMTVSEQPSLETSIDYLRPFVERGIEYIDNKAHSYIKDIAVNYTSVVECIEVVREHRPERGESDEEEDISYEDFREEKMQEYRDEGIEIHAPWNARNLTCYIELPHYTTDFNIPDYGGQLVTEIDVGAFIDPAFLTRVFGSDNASPGNLISILIEIGFYDKERVGEVCVCLYDGFGGFTSVLADYVRDSVIVYHTHPEDNVVLPRPEVVLRSPDTSNVILYSLLTGGVFDLGNNDIYHRYLEEYTFITMLTSDLEHNYPMSVEYITIQCRIVNLFLQNGSIGSVLVMRVDLRNPKLVCLLLSVLRSRCMLVLLLQPTQETFLPGHYIVASHLQGFQGIQDDNFPQNLYNQVCPDTSRRVSRYIERFNRQKITTFHENFNTNLVYRAHPRQWITHQDGSLGYYGIQSYSGCFNQAIPPFGPAERLIADRIATSGDGDEIKTLLGQLNLYPIAVYEQLTADLVSEREQYVAKQTWSADTQAHRLAVLDRIFMLSGYLQGISALTDIRVGIVLNTSSIWDGFSGEVSNWEGRDIPRDGISHIGEMRLDASHIIDRLQISYVRGVHIFMCCLSTVMSLSDVYSANVRRL